MAAVHSKSNRNFNVLYDLILDQEYLVAAIEKAIHIDSARVRDLWLVKFTQNKSPNEKATHLLNFIKNNDNPKQILHKLKEFFAEYFTEGRFDRESIKGVLIHQITALPPNSKQYEIWAEDLLNEMLRYAEQQLQEANQNKVINKYVEKKPKKFNQEDAKKIREEWLALKKTPDTLYWMLSHKKFLVRQLDKILNKKGVNIEAPGMKELKICRDNILHKEAMLEILIELQKFLRTHSDDFLASSSIDKVKGQFFEMMGIIENAGKYNKGQTLVERKWEQQEGHVINRLNAQKKPDIPDKVKKTRKFKK